MMKRINLKWSNGLIYREIRIFELSEIYKERLVKISHFHFTIFGDSRFLRYLSASFILVCLGCIGSKWLDYFDLVGFQSYCLPLPKMYP